MVIRIVIADKGRGATGEGEVESGSAVENLSFHCPFATED